MKSPLMRLLTGLEHGSLLKLPLLAPLEVDAALDDRQDLQFENNWLRIHGVLSAVAVDDMTAQTLRRIRELAFKNVFKYSEHPDLASYVADDFDLFARSLLENYDDAWLNGLFAQYVAGIFPRGQIKPLLTPIVHQL